MPKVSYELRDEPPDFKKCTICGEKAEGGCIPLGTLCGQHVKEWKDMTLKTFWSKKNVESN
tara:strand:+ start:1405 stop:1587 length:183 start_codon:yes stop_codon:yes gene_type:complete